jgi:hypothetical protein
MPVPSTINDLSTTAASNSPSGSETPTEGDNYLRTLSAFIASLRDLTNGTTGMRPKIGNSASASTDVLDYYLEGTFTPALTFGGGSTGITYVRRSGAYTRIGNRVFFELELVLSNKGSSTGSAVITGLPLPQVAPNSFPVIAAGSTMVGLTGVVRGYGEQTTAPSSINLTQTNSNGDNVITDTFFSNTAQITITGSYRV